ncbi:MAG: ClC family H(+)/Cl(-) exchange transporter [Caldiserica bacterium]|nr:ClC family H(+)/Cl(-) exchange transporter [Caldisericota bacterium]
MDSMKEEAPPWQTTLSKWKAFQKRSVIQAILVGALVGISIVAFRFLLGFLDSQRLALYRLFSQQVAFIPLWLLVLLILGFLVGSMVKKDPLISGSGIPQIKAKLIGFLKGNWLTTFLFKFIGGVLSIGAGLSLGKEGPSVQLGASLGNGISSLLKREIFEERYLMTCGASAGLTAAFNAPIAGTVFALEELHKSFSPLLLVSVMTASVTADLVSSLFFGLKPIFDLSFIQTLPIGDYIYLLGLGLFLGFLGMAFNEGLIKALNFYDRLKIKPEFRPILPLLLSLPLGFLLPLVLGGGEGLIKSLNVTNYALWFVIVLFISKFVFTLFSYGSGAPGGIFMPILTIGALAGYAYGQVMVSVFKLNPVLINTFAVLAMAGEFAATVKAPVTGILLITEMVGSFHYLLALSTVSLTAYVTTELFGVEPIYDVLMDRIVHANKFERSAGGNNKIIFEAVVRLGSFLHGKRIKDIEWPSRCLVVSIKRGTTEIIPRGNTKLLPGDRLEIIADEADYSEIYQRITEMTSEPKY